MSYEVKNVKTISGLTESTDLIFLTLKLSPISGETVPLKGQCYEKCDLHVVEP